MPSFGFCDEALSCFPSSDHLAPRRLCYTLYPILKRVCTPNVLGLLLWSLHADLGQLCSLPRRLCGRVHAADPSGLQPHVIWAPVLHGQLPTGTPPPGYGSGSSNSTSPNLSSSPFPPKPVSSFSVHTLQPHATIDPYQRAGSFSRAGIIISNSNTCVSA